MDELLAKLTNLSYVYKVINDDLFIAQLRYHY